MAPALATTLPGGHLLAALHQGMERRNSVARVLRCASKPPQARTSLDVTAIAGETQGIAVLTQTRGAIDSGGAAQLHRDLCHVLRACSLPQMAALRLPGEHPHGLFVYVMQGTLQVRTRTREALDCSFKASTSDSGAAAPSSSSSSSTASEEELRALFDCIDVDGSGAIDASELLTALQRLGLSKTEADVEELMASVDADGSGQLEFTEFVSILNKLGGGSQQDKATWQQLADGGWLLDAPEGSCLGEAALTQGLAQEGMLVALEDCSLLLLAGDVFASVLASGFDIQLSAKADFLRASPVMAACTSNRSDLRGLAHAASASLHSWGSVLVAAGQPCQPGSLCVIQEGSCRVVAKVSAQHASSLTHNGEHQSAAAAAALLATPRLGLHTPRSRVQNQAVDVAVLGPGDILGEAALLGLTAHATSAIVSSAHLSVLQVPLTDLQQLLHPADLQRLVELLKERDVERQARLATAACAAGMLHQQQQHLKDTAAAGSNAAAAQAGVHRSEQRSRPDGGSSSGRDSALQQLLPSSGAAAAAAIAAAGGAAAVHNAPSKASRAEAHAVSHLLQQLTQAGGPSRTVPAATASAAGAAPQRACLQPAADKSSSSCPGAVMHQHQQQRWSAADVLLSGRLSVKLAAAVAALQPTSQRQAPTSSPHHQHQHHQMQHPARSHVHARRLTAPVSAAAGGPGNISNSSGGGRGASSSSNGGGQLLHARLVSLSGRSAPPQQLCSIFSLTEAPLCIDPPPAVAAAQAQLASGSIRLPSPRARGHPSSNGGSCSGSMEGSLLRRSSAMQLPDASAACSRAAGMEADSPQLALQASQGSAASSSSGGGGGSKSSRSPPATWLPGTPRSSARGNNQAGCLFLELDQPAWAAAAQAADEASWLLSSRTSRLVLQGDAGGALQPAVAQQLGGARTELDAAAAANSAGAATAGTPEHASLQGAGKCTPNPVDVLVKSGRPLQRPAAVPRLQLHTLQLSVPALPASTHALPAFSPRGRLMVSGRRRQASQ